MCALVFNSGCSKKATVDTQSSVKSSTDTSNTKAKQSGTEFDNAFAQANKLRMQAAELKFEWVNTEKYLLDAKKEFANGNTDAALLLVKKAHTESELAIKQAHTEATAWKSRVPN
jgi:hypothetical protein